MRLIGDSKVSWVNGVWWVTCPGFIPAFHTWMVSWGKCTIDAREESSDWFKLLGTQTASRSNQGHRRRGGPWRSQQDFTSGSHWLTFSDWSLIITGIHRKWKEKAARRHKFENGRNQKLWNSDKWKLENMVKTPAGVCEQSGPCWFLSRVPRSQAHSVWFTCSHLCDGWYWVRPVLMEHLSVPCYPMIRRHVTMLQLLSRTVSP